MSIIIPSLVDLMKIDLRNVCVGLSLGFPFVCICEILVFLRMSDRFAQPFHALICKSGILKVYNDKWSFCHQSQREMSELLSVVTNFVR